MVDSSLHVRHERIRGDGVSLHVAIAGGGPPVILLHGFPEHWHSWRKQLPALAEAGFSAWAVDMRGYGGSDAPAARGAYHLRHLITDVAAIVRATGHPRAHIVGHDWGGIVAWTFAGHLPDLVGKLVIINAPHFEIYMKKVRSRPSQLLRSWYAAFFLMPQLPEALLSARDFAVVRHMFERYPARPGAFNDKEIDEHVRALARPGRLTSALNYYRANAGRESTLARSARIRAETLVIWGERDPALTLSLLKGLDRVAPRVSIRRLPGVGHWAQNEAPDQINQILVAFLGRGEAS